LTRRIAVDHVRETFIREIASARNLVQSIHALPRQSPRTAGIHPSHVLQVTELAFMGMVASWEEFLERSLVRYVAGATTDSGYQPTPKFGRAASLGDAYFFLSQNPNYDPNKHFLKVTDYQWVAKTAGFIFSHHTYTCLASNLNLLKYATNIRNRVAHASEKCKTDFVDTAKALKFANPSANKLPQGYTPGKLLFEHVQRHFPQPVIQAQSNHFEAYAQLYESLARRIVP
jgi:hypothetical protein